MANLLHREIKKGEIVVLRKDTFKPEYHDITSRLFRIDGGFGMSDETSGSACFGEFVSDGERCRYEGDEDIDVDETAKWQAENGKFGELTRK